MASVFSFGAFPFFMRNSETRPRSQLKVRCLSGDDSTAFSFDPIIVNGTPSIREKEKGTGALGDRRKGSFKKKWVKDAVSDDLGALWDDGYGSKTVKDYFDGAKEMIRRHDGGPPRWFCPIECAQPLEGSPVLLFVPGLDGIGLGLTLHHKALGKAFEVWCLHIPVYDRTPFEGLVKLVEEKVRLEHASSPNKPIYIVGESFGGCLALAIAARNPEIDLVVILSNPATSFDRSFLQYLIPVLETLPDGLRDAIPHLLAFALGNPMKMAMVDIDCRLPPWQQLEQVFRKLAAMLPKFLAIRNKRSTDIMPMDTLIWRMKLLKLAAAYATSRFHAVKAEVLVLASGKDRMFPSVEEAQRLKKSILNCTVRCLKDSGHALLVEDGINLLTLIKATGKYRRSRKIDFVFDFLPPSISEFKYFNNEVVGWWRLAAGAVMFSTLDNGKMVKGLAGVPNEGPVLLIGNHMLLGFELLALFEEFLREKKIMIRGLGNPDLFSGKVEGSSTEFSLTDWLKVWGGVPVTATNFLKLLSIKSHVLLYPGGSREAHHYKGEEYKLIWPDQQGFVRMAARFGATIVPFGTVGEDDFQHLLLDYNDLIKIPIVSDNTRESSCNAARVRDESKGEVANHDLCIPWMLPKIPSGRFYFLFGKPIETKGMEKMLLNDKEAANKLYLEVKSQVERNIAFLLKKREEDPYRSVIDRTYYRALHSPLHDVPAFDHTGGP